MMSTRSRRRFVASVFFVMFCFAGICGSWIYFERRGIFKAPMRAAKTFACKDAATFGPRLFFCASPIPVLIVPDDRTKALRIVDRFVGSLPPPANLITSFISGPSSERREKNAVPTQEEPSTVNSGENAVVSPGRGTESVTTSPGKSYVSDQDNSAKNNQKGNQPERPQFFWPVRARIISPFGLQNEGINLAVPDGTPVKASEVGTVAYAGSEVKGYGNLVLLRHDNGYVTAYAHLSSIEVQRGQRVGRGSILGTSGQTGNVTSPQLHFEIRKGAQPVDPLKLLAVP